MAILAWLHKVQQALHKCAEAIHNAEHGKGKQEMKRDGEPFKVQAVVSLDENTIAQITPKDKGPDPIQNSIKNATWAAFYAVAAYALVTTFMYCAMVHQNGLFKESIRQTKTQWEAQNRPWVGNGEIGFKQPPVFLVFPQNPVFAKTQVNFEPDIPIKNVGAAPAFHVYTYFVATVTKEVAAPKNLDTLMENACKGADSTAKNIGGVLFPNSPETRTGWSEGLGIPFQPSEVRRIWINICVAYSGKGSGEQPHHTKIWMASWPITGHPTEIRRTANPAIIYYSVPIPNWGVIRTEAD